MQRYPRLRFELSDNTIEEFMANKSWPKATKFRDNKNNGWTFEPLTQIPELAEQVVRGKVKLTAQQMRQMRMLVELLPYYSPKLTAVAVGHLTGEDFYNRLERAISRSERAKLIEGRVSEGDD